MQGRNIKAVYHGSSPINAPLPLGLTVSQVCHYSTQVVRGDIHGPFSDNPTPKFGEALRAQVEERLAFFDSGAPPSRNADALRRVVEELEMENDEEEEEEEITGMEVDEPVLTTLEAEPRKEKKRKRKNDDDMDVDEDDDHSLKKVKLSKEEKKLLKKAKKEKAKAEATANGTKNVVGSFFLLETFLLKMYFRMSQHTRIRTSRQRRKRKKRRRRRSRNKSYSVSYPFAFTEFACPLYVDNRVENRIHHPLTNRIH